MSESADTWSSEKLFFEGDPFYQDLIAAIDNAEASVSLETYIFKADRVGREIESALKRAALRGVRVRLLVDGIGSLAWFDDRDPALESSGVEARVYHPMALANLFSRRTPHQRPLLSRLNRRTHRKLSLIDTKIGYVGSMNFSAEHSARAMGAAAWRDTALRVEGGPIEDIGRAFDAVWRRSHDLASGKRKWSEGFAGQLRRAAPTSPLVRVNFTTLLRRKATHELLKSVRGAARRLWISNPYFVPSGSLMRALRHASKAGADVRVLVPRNSDVFFMPWVATSHYDRLLNAGVRIYEYTPRFLHAKTMLIDQMAMVGSSNLNSRSLFHDFEIDLLSMNPETVKGLEESFLEDLKNSEEIRSPHSGAIVSWSGRMIARLFKKWI